MNRIEKPTPQPSRDMSSYPNPVEIGMSLAAFPVDRLNGAHGEGQLYNVGGTPEDPHATIEVYPERGVVRYSSPDVAITFRSASAPALSQHAVVFHSETNYHLGSLTVFDNGEVILDSQPNPPVTKAQCIAYEGRQEAVRLGSVVDEIDVAPVHQEHELPLLELFGRVGRDPIPGRTKHGRLMARFPLVVEEGQLQHWHPVVVFGPRAVDVLDYVHKGGTYTVRGEPNRYEHEGKTYENVKLNDFTIGDKRSASERQRP